MTLLLILCALAGAPASYRPPLVPPPEPAGVAPSPYEDQLVVPAVDVETRVVLESRIATELPGLVAGAAASDALARQLAADPRWRVVDWDGARVAYQRVADGKEWTVPLRGYHVTPDGVWRTAVVLRPWAPTSVWVTSLLVGRAAAAATSLRLPRINYEGDRGWRAVAWEWGDPGAVLQVYEAAPTASLDAMPRTNDALSLVPNLLGRMAAAADEIRTQGVAASLLPGRVVRRGEPSVSVTALAAGTLEVRAWLRTPGPGVTWARVLDGTLLENWEEPAVAAGTREVLGSSLDRRQLFYLQGRFPVPPGAAFSGTIDFWHQPDTGGEPVQLAAFPVTIPAR